MKRTALSTAAMLVTASSLLYIFGIDAVFWLGAGLCFATVVCAVLSRRCNFGLKPAAVLLVGAAFCLYLIIFNRLKIERIENLSGTEQTVVCRIIEEPEYYGGSTHFEVETDGNNGFDGGAVGKIRFSLIVRSYEEASRAKAGDILRAGIKFKTIAPSMEKHSIAKKVYISAECKDVEIIGHSESVYTHCVDLRNSIRDTIKSYTKGDVAAILEGLLLGGTEEMSQELYDDFKTCGVTHITAVSGMHIGSFCSMIMTALCYVMKRRYAAFVTLFPLLLFVMLAGLTASAVRSGIMCGIMLLSDCLLKKTESINSLSVAVTVMLIYNPFYICDLSFQLSCSATAGVILVTPYAKTVCDRLVTTKAERVAKLTKFIIMTFFQSVGAVVCTLPFQTITFGYISLISPIASIFVCLAAVYAMATCMVGAVLNYVPLLDYIAVLPFAAAELLAEYIRITVTVLADVPFACIPFGRRSIVLWLGLSIALLTLWWILGRPLKTRILVVLVTALLLTAIWSERLFGIETVTVAVPETGDGLCTVVTYGESCVIIGCGDDYYDRYAVQEYLKENGIVYVEMLLLPSNSDICFAGFYGITREIKPNTVIAPIDFESDITYPGKVSYVNDQEVVYVLEGNLSITAHTTGSDCVYELNISGITVVVGYGSYDFDALGISRADIVVSGRQLPENIKPSITVIVNENPECLKTDGYGRAIITRSREISVKFKEGKGMSVYAG